MVTIDLQVDGDGVARASVFDKASLGQRYGCSESTLKRMVRVLDECVPDEFAKQSNQRVYTLEQVQMLDWVNVQLSAQLTYSQIRQTLEGGFPDAV